MVANSNPLEDLFGAIAVVRKLRVARDGSADFFDETFDRDKFSEQRETLQTWFSTEYCKMIGDYAEYLSGNIYELIASEALDEAEILAVQAVDELESQLKTVLAETVGSRVSKPAHESHLAMAA